MKRLFWASVLLLACGTPLGPVPQELLPLRQVSLPDAVSLNGAVFAPQADGTLHLKLIFANHGPIDQQVIYGLCSFSLVAFGRPTAAGRPVWSARQPGPGCVADIGIVHAVPAGLGQPLDLGPVPEEAVLDPLSGKPRYLFVLVDVAGEPTVRTIEAVWIQL